MATLEHNFAMLERGIDELKAEVDTECSSVGGIEIDKELPKLQRMKTLDYFDETDEKGTVMFKFSGHGVSKILETGENYQSDGDDDK